MTAFVVLLRGVNVGGNNKMPMSEFRELLSTLGCKAVATYIQSGNAVFRHDSSTAELTLAIAESVKSKFGFQASVMVLTASEFENVANQVPFATTESESKLLHTWFLQERATNADTGRLDDLASDSETFTLTDAAFYLHAPDGIGRSKLASNVERCLAVAATARNWRTIGKIRSLLEALS